MRYLSTRGGMAPATFSDILLGGLAPDGGLTLPDAYPTLAPGELARWRGLSYPELAFAILRQFADDLPPHDLRALIDKTYTAAIFRSEAITPVTQLLDGVWLLGCPTAQPWRSRTSPCNCSATCSSTRCSKPAAISTSSARPPATPAPAPNTPCAASAASGCSCCRRTRR